MDRQKIIEIYDEVASFNQKKDNPFTADLSYDGRSRSIEVTIWQEEEQMIVGSFDTRFDFKEDFLQGIKNELKKW